MRVAVAAFSSVLAFAACGEQSPPVGKPVEAPPVVEASKPEPFSANVDLATVVTQPMWKPAAVKTVAEGVEISTYPGDGGFSAQSDLPEEVRRSGPGKVRITMTVSKGAIFVSAVEWGDAAKVLSERQLASAGEAPVTLDLPLADLSKATSVMFANGSADGASVGVVNSIEVLQP